MPSVTIPRPNVAIGAGYLFVADIGSALPANTVAGSIFTDAWPGAWVLAGATSKGTIFNDEVKASPIDAAEFYNAIGYETDGTETSIEGELLDINASNLKRVRNGGTITVTGTGATTMSAYKPPLPGAEVRKMIGWESRDNTERIILPAAFQIGRISITRNKGGANKAGLPFKWMAETPTSASDPYLYYTAGVARG